MTYRESCSVECPSCSSTVLVGDRYCSRCGEGLDDVDGRVDRDDLVDALYLLLLYSGAATTCGVLYYLLLL